jgi:uncharacterized protein (TIGR00251 family)
MALPGYLQARPEGVWLFVKVQPRSSKNEIGEVVGNALKVRVTAPPVDAAANEALLRFLAETLDCPRGAVRLLRGQTSRQKTLLITGLAPEAVAERLAKG